MIFNFYVAHLRCLHSDSSFGFLYPKVFTLNFFELAGRPSRAVELCAWARCLILQTRACLRGASSYVLFNGRRRCARAAD